MRINKQTNKQTNIAQIFETVEHNKVPKGFDDLAV